MQIQSSLNASLLVTKSTGDAAAQGRPSDNVTASKASKEDAVPGVIRNLQNGHYKGVADVRLRIVFADKLVALQAAAYKAEINTAADTLRAALEPIVGELPVVAAGEEVSDENSVEPVAVADSIASPLDDFASQVANAVTAAQAAASVDIGGFETTVREAFQALVGALGLVLDSTEASETDTGEAEGDAVESAGATGETAPRDYLAELTAIFEVTLASLLETATGAGALPPLSEPKGNGVAYNKFVAIYAELQGSAEDPALVPDGEPASSGTVDLEA